MKTVRVALVAADLQPASGGLAQNVPRLATALASTGLHVEVHAIGSVPPSSRGVLYVGSAAALPGRLGRSPEMRRRLLASEADLFHANGLWMLPLRYAASAAMARRKPLVVSPRGMLAPWALARSRWRKALARWLVHPGAFESAAGWHATSAQEEDDIRRAGFRQPVCVTPNGVDPPSEDPSAVRAAFERVAPELAGKRVLLFYSRFHSKKRILELMEDFAHLRSTHPAWHLLAVGVPEEYSVGRLRVEAQRLGLSGSATILDGRELPKPYALAEAFVLPTHDENFGQVVGEALAHGVPVLTTTRTPWRELNAIDAGRWVDLRDVREELARLMARSAEDLHAAGMRGRDWVLAHFDWNASARKLAAFYDDLIRAAQGAS